jgi:hypothetical protein
MTGLRVPIRPGPWRCCATRSELRSRLVNASGGLASAPSSRATRVAREVEGSRLRTSVDGRGSGIFRLRPQRPPLKMTERGGARAGTVLGRELDTRRLYFMRAHYYNPLRGVLRLAAQDGCSVTPRSRLISSDPLGLGGGRALEPVTDPAGLNCYRSCRFIGACGHPLLYSPPSKKWGRSGRIRFAERRGTRACSSFPPPFFVTGEDTGGGA